MKTITISRKKWLRGDDNGEVANVLWCKDRNAGCCLGHVIHQTQRCTWNDMLDIDTPAGLYDANEIRSSILTTMTEEEVQDNVLSGKAMAINDGVMRETTRERRLTKLFKSHGIKLVFKD